VLASSHEPGLYLIDEHRAETGTLAVVVVDGVAELPQGVVVDTRCRVTSAGPWPV
jgi:hypothetical protein